MALEESRKRKSTSEMVENDGNNLKIDESTTGPEAKIQKIEDIIPNLQSGNFANNVTDIDEKPEDLSINAPRIDQNQEKPIENGDIVTEEIQIEIQQPLLSSAPNVDQRTVENDKYCATANKEAEIGEISRSDLPKVHENEVNVDLLPSSPKVDENLVKTTEDSKVVTDESENVEISPPEIPTVHENDVKDVANAIKEPSKLILHIVDTPKLSVNNLEEEKSSISHLRDSIVSIQFKNLTEVDRYKEKFLKFLNSFIELDARVQENGLGIEVFKDDSLNPDEWEVCDGTIAVESPESSSPSKKRKKKSKAKKELFVVDATPSSNATRDSMGLRYNSKFVIDAEKKEPVDEVKKPKGQACFNCEQTGHSLRDCPQPKDYSKINEARQKFKPFVKAGRYHLEDEQKFDQFKPGKISSELREAMGLRKNEVPHFVYLMRRLGYPPGWLEEAKFMQSNLELFGVEENASKKVQIKKGLDVGKVIDFPGFNVPLEKDVKDDHRSYGVPPYSDNFSKEAMIKFFNDQSAKENDNLQTCDMEVDREDPVAETSELVKNEDSLSQDDTTLGELEKQKAELLAALDNGDDSNSNLKSENVKKPEEDSPEADCSLTTHPVVKTSSFGTPIIKSSSPYMTLPNPDNFSKDVSPVINFENLPNSTGKYEQMTDVLQKVRDTMKKLQNCNVTQ